MMMGLLLREGSLPCLVVIAVAGRSDISNWWLLVTRDQFYPGRRRSSLQSHAIIDKWAPVVSLSRYI